MAAFKSSSFVIIDRALVREVLSRLLMPALLIFGAFVFGTIGFLIIGGGRWSLLDCSYMTSLTLTTVGYGEVLENMGSDGRFFAMVLMWSGVGVTLYAISTITAFLVEKDLWQILRERKMEKHITALKGHVIVCGFGKTGSNALRELYAVKHPCVLIDINQEQIHRALQHFSDIFYICGDATEEDVLKRAGVENANGLIAVLSDDSHNLLIALQTRYLNASIKIVARCNENELVEKFYRAGIDYVVNPAHIGGMRMASELIRPNVVSFLDRMLRGQGEAIRVEEVIVQGDSPWIGLSLKEIDFYGRTGLLPIALKQPDQPDFSYNPSPDERINDGTVIITIGSPEQISILRNLCSPSGDHCSASSSLTS
jgi:voltage-gated potassium channel